MSKGNVEASDMLAQYAATAIEWDNSADIPKRANSLFDANHRLYKALRDLPEGRSGISVLMTHERPGVRLLAATHSLAWDATRATETLQALEAGGGLHAVSAKYTLRSYMANTLDLDW